MMSPGGSIYEMGAPRSQERKDFLKGPARFAPAQQGDIPLARNQEQRLTAGDVSVLAKSGFTFRSSKGWESFSDPTISTREGLTQAKSVRYSEATRKANVTRGPKERSKGVSKGHEKRGPEGRSQAARKGKETLGPEETARITAQARAGYEQRGLERSGNIHSFTEAFEDTLMGNPAYHDPGSQQE